MRTTVISQPRPAESADPPMMNPFLGPDIAPQCRRDARFSLGTPLGRRARIMGPPR